MFKNPFSFNGRIRRLEYGISYVLYWLLAVTLDHTVDLEAGTADVVIFCIIAIPMLWFFFAQRAKRCHDRNNSGWWQLIPGYGLWMLFGEGDRKRNYYGNDPKIPEVPDWEWPGDIGAGA